VPLAQSLQVSVNRIHTDERHGIRMRLRNIRGAKEKVDSSEYVILEPELYKGKWNTLFENSNPINLEIGMGRGNFIMRLAALNPDINYIGIEKYTSVILRAVEKREEIELKNLYFINYNAESINEIFGKGEIEKIYLNFSDPWPKDRHAKRRLTSKEFLSRYDKCLRKDGHVIVKTDNRALFDFTLEQAKEVGWITDEITYDLHKSSYIQGNIMTEYEEKFVAEGKPIHRTRIYRN